MTGTLERAAWLAGDVLLLAGPTSARAEENVEVSAATGDDALEVRRKAPSEILR